MNYQDDDYFPDEYVINDDQANYDGFNGEEEAMETDDKKFLKTPKTVKKSPKKPNEKSVLNENIKDTKQTKTNNSQTKKSKESDKVRNKNYIGAPVKDSKKTDNKKTGWWNK